MADASSQVSEAIEGARAFGRAARRFEEVGFEASVVDFTFFPFHELFKEKQDQRERVEGLSDAYHLNLGSDEVMVAYLLEVTRKGSENEGLPT